MDKFLHVSPPIGLIKVLQEEVGHRGSPNIYMKQQNAIDPIIYCFVHPPQLFASWRASSGGGVEGGSCRDSLAAGRSCLVGFPWLRLGGGVHATWGVNKEMTKC